MNTRKQWEQNAPAWTELARRGRDIYRDSFNTPAFLAALPQITGLRGLDVGCGEGHNARLVAQRGAAAVIGVDHAVTFVRAAIEAGDAGGVIFGAADATCLPFRERTFDFAVAFMSLMDMPETERVFREVHRVTRPGGFFQFSVVHPCFSPPYRRNLRTRDGRTYAIEVGRYFEEGPREERWLFGAASQAEKAAYAPFEITSVHRTLSSWLNLILSCGFTIEWVGEPHPSDEVVGQVANVQDAQVVAYFLHLRARR